MSSISLLEHILKSQCYINGAWVDAESHETFPVQNPFDQSTVAHVPLCGDRDTTRAIEAAHGAFQTWRDTSPTKRADLLMRWHDLIATHADALAHLMTLEQGKTLAESAGGIAYGNQYIRWYAEEANRVFGSFSDTDNTDQHILTMKQPIGVVAAITPWNFPNAMITRKVAPALAAGCTVVVKPAEDTPLSALALAALAEEAGIPPGVINMITGDPAAIGKTLCAHPKVRKLSFTGSVPVGQLLLRQCADTVKKVTLELGGNAPFIIFNDADIEAACTGLEAAKFRNTGQVCIAANRIFVQRDCHDAVVQRLQKILAQYQIGSGLDPNTQITPMINEKICQKTADLVDEAVQAGAQCIMGGRRIALDSLCYEPTILTGVEPHMRIYQEEIFGPVLSIIPFEDEASVLAAANDTEYALASYVYTRDLGRALRVSRALEFGMVGVNTGRISNAKAPFGGIKHAGIGREGSPQGIDAYLETKYVCLTENAP